MGNTARAAAICLLEEANGQNVHFRLLRYKQQAELFVERFAEYKNASFEIVDNIREFVSGADILISCITAAKGSLICEDNQCYREGMLLIPVHTRGFQNCDLFFDKVFGDDTDHVKGFRYFSRFRQFSELSDVLTGKVNGRENNHERILSYNIGIALHDIVYASHIYDLAKNVATQAIDQTKDTRKFWI